MADINAKGKCVTCQFFIEQFNLGECHFNPVTINKSRNDWCGQYQADAPAISSFTPDNVPKAAYDINTDQVITYDPKDAQKALVAVANALTADPAPAPKNKPGRPKKEAK
jgi:hypothetical protein